MAESNKWPEAKNLEFIRRWNARESRAVLGREYGLKNPREKARYLAGRGYNVIMPMAAMPRLRTHGPWCMLGTATRWRGCDG